jgi:hypothetical protein
MDPKMTEHKKVKGKLLMLKWGLLIVAILLFGMILLRLFPPPDTSGYDPTSSKERCLGARGELQGIRSALQHYYESKHRYPNSLAELQTYVKQKPNEPIMVTDLTEYITSEEGNAHESTVLDGSGGWYYDKATGEVKLNITKPVEHYLGPTIYAEEIPSEW